MVNESCASVAIPRSQGPRCHRLWRSRAMSGGVAYPEVAQVAGTLVSDVARRHAAARTAAEMPSSQPTSLARAPLKNALLEDDIVAAVDSPRSIGFFSFCLAICPRRIGVGRRHLHRAGITRLLVELLVCCVPIELSWIIRDGHAARRGTRVRRRRRGPDVLYFQGTAMSPPSPPAPAQKGEQGTAERRTTGMILRWPSPHRRSGDIRFARPRPRCPRGLALESTARVLPLHFEQRNLSDTAAVTRTPRARSSGPCGRPRTCTAIFPQARVPDSRRGPARRRGAVPPAGLDGTSPASIRPPRSTRATTCSYLIGSAYWPSMRQLYP